MVTNLVSLLPTSGRDPWTVRFPAQLSRNPLCGDHLKVYSVFKFSGSRKRIGMPIVFIYKSVDLILEQCKCFFRVWVRLVGHFHTSLSICLKYCLFIQLSCRDCNSPLNKCCCQFSRFIELSLYEYICERILNHLLKSTPKRPCPINRVIAALD